jgi:O-methyltransferase
MREGNGTIMHCDGLIRECCRKVTSLTGDAAEVGVYRGMSALVICDELPGCTVHLYDTFEGMPDQCGKLDSVRGGDFKDTSVAHVTNLLTGRTISMHVGVFPATSVDVPLKFVHVDCDLYQSTKDAMSWAWRNLVDGGIILCDDYGACECAGAKQAIDEFLVETPGVRKWFWDRLVIISKEARDGN